MVAATISFPVNIDLSISDNIVSPEDYGGAADSDGSRGNGTDNSNAFDAMFADVLANPEKSIQFNSGIYRLTRPIFYVDTGHPFYIRGMGGHQTYLYGDFKGAGDGILDLSNSDADSYSTRGHRISGLGFLSNGAPGDPIGLKLENAFECVVSDINIPYRGNHALANCGVVCTNDNNSKWSNIRSQAGFQPLVYDVAAARVSFTAGSAIITADQATFTSAMAGRTIYFSGGGGIGQHELWTSTIQSVDSDTQITLSSNAPTSKSDIRIAIGDVMASTTMGSDQITLNHDVGADADWVGMQIHIFHASYKGNADQNGILSTRITAVNGANLTLEDAPTVTQSNVGVMFCPAVFIGTYEGFSGNRQTNHSWWTNLHCEGFQAAGLLINRAIYLTVDNLKVHGPAYATATDWAQCYHPLVISEAKTVFLRNIQSAYGIKNSKITVTGSRGLVKLENLEAAHTTKDKAYISCANASDKFRLMVNPMWMTYGTDNFGAGYNPISAPLPQNIEQAIVLNM